MKVPDSKREAAVESPPGDDVVPTVRDDIDASNVWSDSHTTIRETVSSKFMFCGVFCSRPEAEKIQEII